MGQTRERRMYLMWKAANKSQDRRRGGSVTALMRVAQVFRTPVREVRDIIDAQKGKED